MMMMTTYATNQEIEDGKIERVVKNDNGGMEWIQFKYMEIFYNHFTYQHAVDDHNSNWHQPISVEVIWATHCWAN